MHWRTPFSCCAQVKPSWASLGVTWCAGVHSRMHRHLSLPMNNLHFLYDSTCSLGVISSFYYMSSRTPLLYGYSLQPSIYITNDHACTPHECSTIVKNFISIKCIGVYVFMHDYTWHCFCRNISMPWTCLSLGQLCIYIWKPNFKLFLPSFHTDQ